MPTQRILGLDLGTASVGFALIDYDRQAHEGKIIRMGVRVFPETRDAKTAVPLNQQRRTKRLVRRQIRRRKERRRTLNELLHSIGLLPKYGTDDWHSVMKLDPYDLRKKGLVRKLDPYELGRAIYHLSKRRHFLGRDIELEGDSGDEEEDKQSIENREGLLNELKQNGQTLGEWLANLESGKRKRNHLASRDVVVQEFSLLMDKQTEYYGSGPVNLPKYRDVIQSIIFYQRPVFWRKNTLGTCEYDPQSELLPSSSWLAQQRKMIEVINNISIEGNLEPLDREEREAIIGVAQTSDSVTWPKVRKALKPLYEQRNEKGYERSIKFNLETGGMRKIPGNSLERKLSKIFAEDWDQHPSKQQIRENIHQDIFACDYEEINNQRIVILPKDARTKNRKDLIPVLKDKYGVTEAQSAALSELKLNSGWEPFSVNATRSFLKELERGRRMGDLLNSPQFEDWRNDEFPNKVIERTGSYSRLPSPQDQAEQARLKGIRNPTVVRTQNEMRKVVNNIIDLHGKPDIIRVELARDLSMSKKRKTELEKIQRQQEKLREDAIDNLKENHISQPSVTDIQKWLLWKECKHRCPYTGKHIGFDALFGKNPSFDIEHIWPRSRCFIDSMANKTLCLTSENRTKGNRTPYEYLHDDEDRWFHLVKRLNDMKSSAGSADGMSASKIRRFLQKEIPQDFTQRQLVDTSYAAKEAVNSLVRLWSSEENALHPRVQAVSGRATALMRRLWGLGGILDLNGVKTREDHRHHAIDALVIACIDPGIRQQLAEYWKAEEEHRSMVIPKPWSSIRLDAEKHKNSVIVSHKVQKKVSGALHEESVYGKTREVSEDGKYTNFVRRKSISEVTGGERKNIRDESIRESVQQSPLSKKVAEIQHVDGKNPIKKVRIIKRLQPQLVRKVTTGYVETGANHHVALYRNESGEIEYDVVTLIEAAFRLRKKLPVIQRQRPRCTFLNSLSKSDSLSIESGEYQGIWIVNTIQENGQVRLTRHFDASGDRQKAWSPRVWKLISKYQFKKISVDPIGRIRTAND